MNWQQWKEKYREEIFHIAGYEEQFVDSILMKIDKLSPEDVIPQYHFIDNQGKNRYIDFMIINQQKNWILAIELDGYAKMVGNGDDYARFQDFLERQNAMMRHFKMVLRYTNRAMFNHSENIIKEISDVLNRQLQEKSTKDIQEANIKQTIKDYEDEIKKLRTQSSKYENKELFQLLANIQQELQLLKQQSYPQGKKVSFKFISLCSIMVVATLFIFYLYNKKEQSYSSQGIVRIEKMNPPVQYKENNIETVCGFVAEVKYNRKNANNYLNINDKFPNQDITITVWIDQDLSSYYTGKNICTYGEIKEHKGRLYVNVNSLRALKEVY